MSDRSSERVAVQQRMEDYVAQPPPLRFTVDEVVSAGRRQRRRRTALLAVAASVVLVGSGVALLADPPRTGDQAPPTAPSEAPSFRDEDHLVSTPSEMPKVLSGLAAVTFPGTAEADVTARTWTYDPAVGRGGQARPLAEDDWGRATNWLLTMEDGPVVDGRPRYEFRLGSRFVPPDWGAELWLRGFCTTTGGLGRCAVNWVNGGWELTFERATAYGSDVVETLAVYRLADGLLTHAQASVSPRVGAMPFSSFTVETQSLQDAVRDLLLRFVRPDPEPGLPSTDFCTDLANGC